MELYPDSVALRELSDRFSQRREGYLSQIAQDFERYLAPEFLLPEPGGDDLHDLLGRLAGVDSTNPLLDDSRVPGAYADSVEAALGEEDYALARRYLDAGLTLAPADVTLADLRDRVVAAEQRLEREAAIARLTDQLEAGAAEAETLADAEALVPVVAELQGLDPGNVAIAAVGAELAARMAGDREAALTAERLPEVEAWLERSRPVWIALAQPEMVAPVEARRVELADRQEALVRQTREAIRQPDMRTDDGRSAIDLIAAVRALDPDDPRSALLQSELVQARRERADERAAEAEWEAARAELAALDGMPLSSDQRAALALDLQRIDTAEQRAREQAQASARLAEAQRQAEMERQEQERLRQRAAEREARIADAATRLERSLAGFDPASPVPSMREALDRINELEALQPDHPLLADAGRRIDEAVEQAVRRQSSTPAGLALIDTAESLLGSKPALVQLRTTLRSRLAAEQAAARQAAITVAEARLREALRSAAALAEDSGRETAERALADLSLLLAGDAARLAPARRSYVDAHLAAADGLMAEKRFTVAERVLDAAARHAEAAQVADARDALESARQAFREERVRQESLARIEALAQRFSLEVNSGQLTRARQTLEDYRALDPDGPLARGEGDQRLVAGYHRIARQRLDAGNFDGARQLVATGLAIVPGHGALEELGREVDRLSLLAEISSWFNGAADQSVADLRPLIRRYRDMAPDDYANQEVAWAASAARRLTALTGDRDAYNRFLEDARSVLQQQGPLADLAMLPPPRPETRPAQPVERPEVAEVPIQQPPIPETAALPQLSYDDLLGRWCADNIEIEFERRRMVFTLDGGQADYRISGYDVNGDTIHVNWDDRRLGPMIFEFGRFTEGKDRMVQLRGRPAAADDWQTYNRDFLRCG
jgi:hypothetical protein